MNNIPDSKTTAYAPAERATLHELKNQNELMKHDNILTQVADSVSSLVIILNKERQIVYGNKTFLSMLGSTESENLIGKRPGEAINCMHASQSEGGCGTTQFCSVCGAVNAILEAQQGTQTAKECRIITNENEALDLKVTATPYYLNEEQYIFFAIADISNEKRRQTLERVFFHDILNSAGGISGLSSIMPMISDMDEMTETAEIINRAANFLVDEIKSQRMLTVAESGDLVLSFTQIESLTILKELGELYSQHEVIRDKILSVDKNSVPGQAITDSVLLRRVLGNMVKNALEASTAGGKVTLSCTLTEDAIRFTVHNGVYMPQEIQLQLFKRSFSTKGIGRGIGTYSMKLFGEKYLKGKVGFESTKENGTTFFIEIPKVHPEFKEKK
ncbi:MAG: histidine kinase [Bacteroidetes bacterium HGW-Bacteroidetes-16]|nr:MAG: histidine kinase [Bacteroidetes bacterium HGW-Bacteroidetes-16]